MVFGWPASEGATFNFGWLNGQPFLREFGTSTIGAGVAGGFDPNTGQDAPPYPLFGGTGSAFGSPISVGFSIGLECLSCDPPRIATQPQDQSAVPGSDVQFSVGAVLTPQLSCQWYCNGIPISGAVQFVLNLANVSVAQNGNVYFAVLSNPWGSVTSSSVTLNVSSSVPFRLVPGLRMSGASGIALSMVQSDALGSAVSWSTWQHVVLDSTPQWLFDVSESVSQRFYRSVQTPGAGPGPSLELHLVPAIMLTGTVGRQIEVDYLQQSGSTNAWVAVATVGLTNASQYFFDTAAIGQPPRLYRLLPK